MNVGADMGTAARTTKGARDFDFWLGRWKVRNRYLRGRLQGSSDWVEFEATSVARSLLDGLGNEDEFRTDHDGGFIGMSFRFIWSGVTTPTPRWEQAFSDDGGKTWETNWIMDFTRTDD